MNNHEVLSALRETQKEMKLWADLDADTKPLCDNFDAAIDHIDALLSEYEYTLVQLVILSGRVSKKLQIPLEDARNIVSQMLGEDTMAGIVCGLVLEISEQG